MNNVTRWEKQEGRGGRGNGGQEMERGSEEKRGGEMRGRKKRRQIRGKEREIWKEYVPAMLKV